MQLDENCNYYNTATCALLLILILFLIKKSRHASQESSHGKWPVSRAAGHFIYSNIKLHIFLFVPKIFSIKFNVCVNEKLWKIYFIIFSTFNLVFYFDGIIIFLEMMTTFLQFTLERVNNFPKSLFTLNFFSFSGARCYGRAFGNRLSVVRWQPLISVTTVTIRRGGLWLTGSSISAKFGIFL